MSQVIHSATLQAANRTARFEGYQHGSEVSFFMVDNEPGEGPRLHVHPYTETWIVRSGEVEFTVGQERFRAGAGDIAVGPAGIPHRFVNVGTGRLEVVCIHANDRIEQDWVDQDWVDNLPAA